MSNDTRKAVGEAQAVLHNLVESVCPKIVFNSTAVFPIAGAFRLARHRRQHRR
jgi:hypothetical protein